MDREIADRMLNKIRGFCLCLSLVPAALAADRAPATYCNPLNLDYGWRSGNHRHGADPVIVLFKDKYFLFSTWDVPGFRFSEDLLHWKTREFPKNQMHLFTSDNGLYCAPAVAARGDWLYFINMIPRKAQPTASIMRTRDPLSDVWEECGQIKKVKDPCLFFNDDGRAWLYHGLSRPTHVFEIDTRDWREIPGSEVQLRAAITNTADFAGGYERGRREIFGETDTAALLGNLNTLPCQEAAWLTKYKGRYYLQYATPGTLSQWYCDVAMEGDSPTGPFKLADYSPVSMKVGGFIGSAGHSGVFQDRRGQWWRVTTMWIGVHDGFERRLGLFAVEVDQHGRMRTDTRLGDYPRRISDGKLAGWMVQSDGATCTASSSLAGHAPERACDEDVRTWWSAKTGADSEWLQMDLGGVCTIRALQVNLAEQDARFTPEENHIAYRLLASPDGSGWQLLNKNPGQDTRTSLPHQFFELDQPIRARYLRIENVHTACGGRFAVSDLRVFGSRSVPLPGAPTQVGIQRHEDDRNVTVRWAKAPGAKGYLVNYGASHATLYNCIQVKGGHTEHLTFHALTRGAKYAWRVDAFNEAGETIGNIVAGY